MANTHDPESLLTSREASQIAGVPLRRLQKWVESYQLPTVRRSPSTLIARSALEQFLQSRQTPDAPALHGDELTAQEAAKLSRVSPSTIQAWVRQGRLPAIR
jgi:predicted site-specific integrase-resolvase